MTTLLEARDVAKWFRPGTGDEVRALDGVSISVPRGAFVVLTGPSGSGKSTLLALLGTIERPTGGAVFVEGTDPSRLSEAARSRLRRRIGFAFPGGPMIAGLPLWENLTLGLVLTGASVEARRAAALDRLTRVGLAEKLRALPEELSTGQLQRAALARALVGRPEILLVDEPLANVDAATGELVTAALEEAHAQGSTLVVASHDPEAFRTATAWCRLEAGRRVDAAGSGAHGAGAANE